MERDPGRVSDGFVSLERGMDSGRASNTLARNQVSFAINTTFRGGFPQCRPGFRKVELSFTDSTALENFEDNLFQGASYYAGWARKSFLVAAIGGRLFRVDPSTGGVTDISVVNDNDVDASSSNLEKAWFAQGQEYLVVQDNQSKPVIFNGSESRRAVEGELPVGNIMAYGMGRFTVALPDGISFIMGDLLYGSSGTETAGFRDSILKVTENDFLNEGGVFTVPSSNGSISSIAYMANLDTSLGQGPMLVFTQDSIYSVNAPIDRALWKAVQYPIQTVALIGNGCVGDRGTVLVNNDIFYRSMDGIRSFALARREFGSWGNTPVSAEMNRVLEDDDKSKLNFGSSVLFDNRLLSTVSPYRSQGHGVAHRGLAVLDFDILSRMSGKEPPCWEGIWTGLNVLQLVSGNFDGEDKCYAFALNGAGQIELWELTHDAKFDGDSDRITWSIEGRSFDFQSPWNLKRLESADLFVDNVVGQVGFNVDYRPDQNPKWQDWHDWTETAKYQVEESEVDPDYGPPLYREQYRSKMRLPSPQETGMQAHERPLKVFYELQPRIEITGQCRLKQMRLNAMQVQDTVRGDIRT
jgi:hypothetical protein